MKYGLQNKISAKSGVSNGFISLILSGQKRPSWKTAKKLAAATNTDPVLWLDGSPDDIKQAITWNQEMFG